MRGRISLSSEPYKGSTFSVQIKLEKLASYESEKNHLHRFSHLNVICFDDNPLHLEAICNGLGFWGINCARVSTQSQLEELFKKTPAYDFAFISMNRGQEAQMTRLLKKHSVPTIFVSKWLIQDYEALGAQGFLFKPPNMQKLHDTVESLLNKVTLTKTNNHTVDKLRQELRVLNPVLLVAEDNPVNRMLLHSLFHEKASIETVNDGKQAVAICNHKHFNAILLDLEMPILNGLKAASLIHQESILNKNTPIILISANNCDLNSDLFSKAGIHLCLQKPIDEESLLRHILTIVTKAKTSSIDWSTCVQKLSGNEALATEFLTRFVQELRKNREEFLQLMHHQQLEDIEHLAHKLHGACCFCGVPTLQYHVANVEKIARNSESCESLQTAFAELIQSIDEVLLEYENSYV